MAAFIR